MSELSENRFQRLIIKADQPLSTDSAYAERVAELENMFGQDRVYCTNHIAAIDADIFNCFILDANGTMRYKINDPEHLSVIGDFKSISIQEAWQSQSIQRVRVDRVNEPGEKTHKE
jgi:hypothetical protein